MRLDLDCVRAILKSVEDVSSYNSIIIFEEETYQGFPRLSEYSFEVILYHVKKCCEAGFFTDVEFYYNSIKIGDLYIKGHEFLNVIRDDKPWKKVTSIAKKAGATSLNAVFEIAVHVGKGLISNALS